MLGEDVVSGASGAEDLLQGTQAATDSLLLGTLSLASSASSYRLQGLRAQRHIGPNPTLLNPKNLWPWYEGGEGQVRHAALDPYCTELQA